MERNTKQRILNAALDLFSEKGYEAVSVAEIAEKVGIKAPSLYKHYSSKRDIFDSILSQMNSKYKERVSGMNLDGFDPQSDAEKYLNISEQMLIEMGKNLFMYFLNDDYTCKFRKMLTIEQFRNSETASLFSKQYYDDVIGYQSAMFGLMSDAGLLKKENPQIMALHFYSAMYLLITVCDRQPERVNELLETLEQHIRQFNRIYGRKEKQ